MKTLMNIKTDKEIKNKAQRLSKELGLSLSAVINAYLKQFVRTREVYFSVVPRMNSVLEELVGRAEKDLKRGRNVSRVFTSAEEAARYLSS